MIDEDRFLEEFEATGVKEPVKFRDIVMKAMNRILEAPAGSKDRHKAIRDLADILYPYYDDDYEKGVEKAKIRRNDIENNKVKDVDSKEAFEIHQSLWIQQLSGLLKRKGFYAEEFGKL